MPCLNEARTLTQCIAKAQLFLKEHGIAGEVIVADNGSNDGSIKLATEIGARVVTVETHGYGAALTGGIDAAQGKFVIVGDSDGSYDFSGLLPFVEKLRAGYDLVVGNRFQGVIGPGAMPALHRYFGNPFLSAVARTAHHGGAHHAFSRWPRSPSASSLVQRWLEKSSVLPLDEPPMVLCGPGADSLADRCDRFGRVSPWPDRGGICFVRLSHTDVFDVCHRSGLPIHTAFHICRADGYRKRFTTANNQIQISRATQNTGMVHC